MRAVKGAVVAHLPGRRLRYGRVLGCALPAAVALALALPTAASADAGPLVTDAGGAPLVTAVQLAPGHVVTRCLVVSTTTPYASADLGMYATATGRLADHLDVTVETGTGGGFAGCAGFVGRQVFTGTLSGLAAGFEATHPLRVGHYSSASQGVTLRLSFTVEDTNAAQGQSTVAALWWLPLAADPVVPPPVPSSTPPTTATPTTSAPVSPAAPTRSAPASRPAGTHSPTPPAVHTRPPDGGNAAPVTRSHPTPSTTPAPAPAPAATSLAPGTSLPVIGHRPDPPAGPGAGGKDTAAAVIGSITQSVKTAAQAVSQGAAPALRGAAYTSLLILPPVLLFLLVQRRIDRRDPKLALAPSYGDPFLGFADRARIRRQGDPA